MKEKKLLNLFELIFITVGVIFIAFGIFISMDVLDKNNKIETTGVITDIETYRDSDGDVQYRVYVKYEVNGRGYLEELGSYESSFYTGKEIDIYYYKDAPNRIGAKSTALIVLIFPMMGIISFSIGMIGVIIKIRNNKLKKHIVENGELIYADYVQTIINTNLSFNGRNPYNIICEWINPINNKKYIFKSENIYFNPIDIIEDRNIKRFPVYMEDEKRYIINIACLTDDILDPEVSN